MDPAVFQELRKCAKTVYVPRYITPRRTPYIIFFFLILKILRVNAVLSHQSGFRSGNSSIFQKYNIFFKKLNFWLGICTCVTLLNFPRNLRKFLSKISNIFLKFLFVSRDSHTLQFRFPNRVILLRICPHRFHQLREVFSKVF